MKKLLLIVAIAMICSLNCKAQENFFSIGLGMSATHIDAGNASCCGLKVELDYDYIHLDVATNMATGKGDQLDFTSDRTYTLAKKKWASVNLGYNIKFLKDGCIKYIITPKIGFIKISEILQDPIGWDTFCMGESETKPQVAIDFGFRAKQILIKLGVGTTEYFSMSISWFNVF